MSTSDLIEIRQHLHKNPELSLKEFETQKYLFQKLKDLNHQGLSKVGGTGLAMRFIGEKPGKKILIRGDIDALPILEINSFGYASRHDGVSHKCGHDGHATILVGLARRLSEVPIKSGEVCLLFQPAEEIGKGAQAVIDDPNFGFQADLAFALHNLPGFPLHQIICKPSSFTAAVKSVVFKLNGKTAHAAEPEYGMNPGLAIAEIIQYADGLCQKEGKRDDFALSTLIHVNIGERAYGVSAGYGEVHFTLRSWSNRVMDELSQSLINKAQLLSEENGLKLDYQYLEEFHSNTNDQVAYELVEKAASLQNLSFLRTDVPFRFGEDFGLFTERFSGAMFGIGAGETCPALHNPDYDFPDALIETGVTMFDHIIRIAETRD